MLATSVFGHPVGAARKGKVPSNEIACFPEQKKAKNYNFSCSLGSPKIKNIVPSAPKKARNPLWPPAAASPAEVESPQVS